MKPELKVGLTVSFALILLGFALWWAKDVRVGSKKIGVRFENVSGLQPGDPVMISGLRIGKVDDIALRDGYVYVQLSVSPEVVLYRNATARIAMLELMTGKKVELYPGSKEAGELAQGEVIRGTFLADIPDLVGGAGSTIDTLKILIADVRRTLQSADAIIGDETVQENLKISIQNLRSATTDLAVLSRDLRSANIKALIANIDRTIATVEKLINDIQPELKGALSDARGTLRNADSLVVSLKDLTQRLKTDRSTLVGKVLNDEQFVMKLDSVVSNLDSVLKLGQKAGIKVQLRIF
ncbi:MAG: MCE family protein [Candidatus Thermochlorobacter aerophilum]|jgi:phospholipid/cholesterol/gamma-HCH transport system substrate-binding protein|uniref:MCE family protein n=1 Tax=Candidatus Thermochlorobacter aerophilus TaxID=1868324 RepID=A0A395M495_9BACT|nr:MAG: MCE family protein [Candidatus Thermochlorobacter aerophilum]